MISEGFFLSVLVKKTQKKNTQKKLIFQFENFQLNFSIQKVSK